MTSAFRAEHTPQPPPVLATGELEKRRNRPARHEAENRALVHLTRTLADNPDHALQALVDATLELCEAGSAGISLLEDTDSGPQFRWRALAGAAAGRTPEMKPCDRSPCGLVVEQDRLALFDRPARFYAYLDELSPHIEEALLAPIHVGMKTIGTLWVLTHHTEKRFDAEDARLLTNLANVAGAACRLISALRIYEADRHLRDRIFDEIQTRNVELSIEVEERKRIADALKRSEERLRLAMEALDLGTFEWNIPADRAECSPNVKRLFGNVSDEPSTLQEILARIHPEDRDAAEAGIRAAIESRGERIFAGEFRTALTPPTWVNVRGAVLLDEHGEPQCMVGIVLDITQRKLQESELRRTAAELGTENRLKDEFMATLAHELRNPLTPIRNGLEILALTGLTHPTQRRACDVMSRQLRHLVRLVDDLLDISRVTQGKLTLKRETVSLQRLIESAVETIMPQIEAAQHELTLDVPSEPLLLEVDPVRIAQAVGNVLANSARYTPAGGRIELSARPALGGVEIRVRDNGIGIAPDLLPRIFDMFAQGRRDDRHTETGLGIGLALTRALVTMHGGTVRAESEGTGKGSTFVLWLPVAPSGARAGVADKLPAIATKRRRVLVVDDDVDSADSMAALLGLMGHEVHEARDGLQAVHAARVFEPDLIFMDIGMPGLDGHEAARRIRNLPLPKRPMIVALTWWGQEFHQVRSREAGIDAHLVKPVDAGTIARLLSELNGAASP
jgi:PAS domain S-box-containing protein